MDDIISDAEIRFETAGRRLGDYETCFCCPEADPRCLELHHIAGQAHHGDLVAVCRNCHRKLSDSQRDHPNGTAPTMLVIIGHYLLGLADFLILLAARLKEFGHALLLGLSLQGEPV